MKLIKVKCKDSFDRVLNEEIIKILKANKFEITKQSSNQISLSFRKTIGNKQVEGSIEESSDAAPSFLFTAKRSKSVEGTKVNPGDIFKVIRAKTIIDTLAKTLAAAFAF